MDGFSSLFSKIKAKGGSQKHRRQSNSKQEGLGGEQTPDLTLPEFSNDLPDWDAEGGPLDEQCVKKRTPPSSMSFSSRATGGDELASQEEARLPTSSARRRPRRGLALDVEGAARRPGLEDTLMKASVKAIQLSEEHTKKQPRMGTGAQQPKSATLPQGKPYCFTRSGDLDLAGGLRVPAGGMSAALCRARAEAKNKEDFRAVVAALKKQGQAQVDASREGGGSSSDEAPEGSFRIKDAHHLSGPEQLVTLEGLGRGCGGNVHRAVHATTLHFVAVKEVPVHDEARLQQAKSEILALVCNLAANPADGDPPVKLRGISPNGLGSPSASQQESSKSARGGHSPTAFGQRKSSITSGNASPTTGRKSSLAALFSPARRGRLSRRSSRSSCDGPGDGASDKEGEGEAERGGELTPPLPSVAQCPNVVAFHDAYANKKKEKVAVVLELCSNGSLQDILSNEKVNRIPEAQLAVVAYDVLSGIEFIHHRGLLHRDIKPGNILLTIRDGRPTAKVADFGLVKDFGQPHALAHAGPGRLGRRQDAVGVLVDPAELLAKGTEGGGEDCEGLGGEGTTRTFIGTPVYMSPERLQGQPYGYPSDVWSVGLTLLTCALGRYPVDVPSEDQYWFLLQLFSSEESVKAQGSGSRKGKLMYGEEPEVSEAGGASVQPGTGPLTNDVLLALLRAAPGGADPAKRLALEGLSEGFVNFLCCCLQKDPKTRWTASQLLAHPWVRAGRWEWLPVGPRRETRRFFEQSSAEERPAAAAEQELQVICRRLAVWHRAHMARQEAAADRRRRRAQRERKPSFLARLGLGGGGSLSPGPRRTTFSLGRSSRQNSTNQQQNQGALGGRKNSRIRPTGASTTGGYRNQRKQDMETSEGSGGNELSGTMGGLVDEVVYSESPWGGSVHRSRSRGGWDSRQVSNDTASPGSVHSGPHANSPPFGSASSGFSDGSGGSSTSPRPWQQQPPTSPMPSRHSSGDSNTASSFAAALEAKKAAGLRPESLSITSTSGQDGLKSELGNQAAGFSKGRLMVKPMTTSPRPSATMKSSNVGPSTPPAPGRRANLLPRSPPSRPLGAASPRQPLLLRNRSDNKLHRTRGVSDPSATSARLGCSAPRPRADTAALRSRSPSSGAPRAFIPRPVLLPLAGASPRRGSSEREERLPSNTSLHSVESADNQSLELVRSREGSSFHNSPHNSSGHFNQSIDSNSRNVQESCVGLRAGRERPVPGPQISTFSDIPDWDGSSSEEEEEAEGTKSYPRPYKQSASLLPSVNPTAAVPGEGATLSTCKKTSHGRPASQASGTVEEGAGAAEKEASGAGGHGSRTSSVTDCSLDHDDPLQLGTVPEPGKKKSKGRRVFNKIAKTVKKVRSSLPSSRRQSSVEGEEEDTIDRLYDLGPYQSPSDILPSEGPVSDLTADSGFESDSAVAKDVNNAPLNPPTLKKHAHSDFPTTYDHPPPLPQGAPLLQHGQSEIPDSSGRKKVVASSRRRNSPRAPASPKDRRWAGRAISDVGGVQQVQGEGMNSIKNRRLSVSELYDHQVAVNQGLSHHMSMAHMKRGGAALLDESGNSTPAAEDAGGAEGEEPLPIPAGAFAELAAQLGVAPARARAAFLREWRRLDPGHRSPAGSAYPGAGAAAGGGGGGGGGAATGRVAAGRKQLLVVEEMRGLGMDNSRGDELRVKTPLF